MIIIYGIKAGNDCPAIKVPSCERTVGPRAVVSIRELDKHLQSKKADYEAFYRLKDARLRKFSTECRL